MNYLTGAQTQANIAVLLATTRWLRHAGAVSFAELSVTLRPSALVGGADDAFRASLKVGQHIGIFHADREDGQWSLGPRLTPEAVETHHSFRKAVRAAM